MQNQLATTVQTEVGRRSEQRLLEGFLLGPGDPPDAALIHRCGLAGWAYATMPSHHTIRPGFRSAFASMLARHHALKRELLPLLTAWRSAGVDVLMFKGFWLAETVYPVAGARFHGDVDLLLRASQIGVARAIATNLGWIEHAGGVSKRPYSHAAFNLQRPSGQTWIDVHRFVLHSQLRWNGAQRRITDAVWRSARRCEWEGIDVYEPDPIDAMLILMLQRCWGDHWRLKPADPLDLRLLIDTFRIRADQLVARARTLHCERSVHIFLQRCDPWNQRLDLSVPAPADVRRYQRNAIAERPLLAVEALLARLARVPGLTLDIIRVLPSIVRACIALRRRRDIHGMLRWLTPPEPPGQSSALSRARTVSGARWAVKPLAALGWSGCLLRSLALYHALRLQGWPVTFVSGLRRERHGPAGHAWLELNGMVLPELLEPNNQQRFTVALRYPAAESNC